MARFSFISTVAHLLSLIHYAALSAAWVNLPTQIDLSWPPISVWREVYIHGHSVPVQWPNMTAATLYPTFDCAHFALDPNVARTDFPITGGMVQLNLSAHAEFRTNETENQWEVMIDVGQFSGLTADAYIGGDYWTPESSLNNIGWTEEQVAAGLGSRCTPGLNIPATANGTWMVKNSLLNMEQLDGMNATLRVSITRGYGRTTEMMTQCSYIRLINTTSTDSRGPCRVPSLYSPSTSSTVNPSPASTFPPAKSEHQGLSPLLFITILCPTLFLLVLGCCGWRILRRRRARQHQLRNRQPQVTNDGSEYESGLNESELTWTGYEGENIPRSLNLSATDNNIIMVPPPTYDEALKGSSPNKA